MYIIVGLGNPGKKYENTRHNLGFMTIDVLGENHGISVEKIKFKALVGEGRIAGQGVILVKPQTYMNLSGESVREVMNFYKVPTENLIVIYDDLDISVGQIRIRKFGSSGTHNGMKSVIYQIKSDRFPRIRLGIGSDNKGDLKNFVTGGFNRREKPLVKECVEKAAEAVEVIISEGIESAMNNYNTKKKVEKDGKKGTN